MQTAKAILVVFLGVLFFWGLHPGHFPLNPLVPPAEAVQKAAGENKEGAESRGIKDLPCFKCHIYDQFLQEPAPGVFSHALHVQFDYHCNQCHSFRGHRQMVINTAICQFCHDAVPELKKP